MSARRKRRVIRFTAAKPDSRPTPVRCTKRLKRLGPEARCGWRGTLPKAPAEYTKHPPKCPRCGTRITYIDTHRARAEWGNKKARCCCYGYAFPHARGRGFCNHNPKLTAEDLRVREEGGPRRAADDPPF